MSEYIESLAPDLLRSYRLDTPEAVIDLKLKLERVYLSIEKAIPFGLILNELICNAVKHAFDGRTGGRIEIELASKEKLCTLIVRDDGVGIPDGIDCHHTKTLGLSLVNSLAHQLGGDVELRRQGKTEFAVRFKEEGNAYAQRQV